MKRETLILILFSFMVLILLSLFVLWTFDEEGKEMCEAEGKLYVWDTRQCYNNIEEYYCYFNYGRRDCPYSEGLN